MAKSSGIHEDVFNEVDNKDPNKPDSMGVDLYFGLYDDVISSHGSYGPDAMMGHTPNAEVNEDMWGHPAKGEPSGIPGEK